LDIEQKLYWSNKVAEAPIGERKKIWQK